MERPAGASRDEMTEADGRRRTSHRALTTCVGIHLRSPTTPHPNAGSDVIRLPSASVILRAHHLDRRNDRDLAADV